MQEWFDKLAHGLARQAGSLWFFMASLFATIAWVALGPYFNWSEGYNFLANSSTTLMTWSLAVLLLRTQNRDTEAIQLKLAELIRANATAHDRLATIEDATEAERNELRDRFRQECESPAKEP